MKQKWFAWILAVVMAVSLAAFATQANAEGSRGVLYRVTKGNTTMYLLGSIHIGSEAMYPFDDTITEAMAQADTFVFECDSESAEAVAMMQQRMMADGSLKDALGEECYQQLGEVCVKLGLPETAFDWMRPWAVINVLSLYATAEQFDNVDINAAMALGVENEVIAYGREHDKSFRYLESLDEQISTMESFSNELLMYILQDTNTAILTPELSPDEASTEEWPEWWRTGNANAFADQYLSTYIQPGHEDVCNEYHQKLLVQRNRIMADRLDEMLQEDGTYFVTIGLLHVVLPEESVLTLLKNKGWTVECLSGMEEAQ